LQDVAETELTTGATTKAENLTILCEYHRVNVTARRVRQFVEFQRGDASGDWLVGVSILISWETRGIGVAQLAAGTRTPRV